MKRIGCPILVLAILGVGFAFAQSPETDTRQPKVAILECGYVDNTAVSPEAQLKLTKAIVSKFKSSKLILESRTPNPSTMNDISYGFSSFQTPATAAGILDRLGLDAGYIVNAEEDINDLILTMTRIDAEGGKVLRDTFTLTPTSPHIAKDSLFQKITLNPNVKITLNPDVPRNRGFFPGWVKWALGGATISTVAYFVGRRDRKEIVEVAPPSLPK